MFVLWPTYWGRCPERRFLEMLVRGNETGF